MSRFNPESLRLDIRDTEACLQVHAWRQGWQQLATVPLESSYRFQPEPLMERLPALLEGRARGGRLTILLPDKAARFFMVTPPDNLARFSDLKAVAALRFETLLGLPAADWRIEADWQAGRPFLACALPLSLLAPLQKLAVARGLRITTVQPAFVRHWNQWRTKLAEGDWLASCGGSRAVVAVAGKKEMAAVFQIDLPAEWQLHPEIIKPVIEETGYRQQLKAPSRIYLAGEAGLAWERVALDGVGLDRAVLINCGEGVSGQGTAAVLVASDTEIACEAGQ